MTEQRPPLSIEQQADLIQYLTSRCQMLDGSDAGKTHMTLTAQDVADLRHIETRLRRIAPFEAQIRRMVTQR